MALTGVRSSGVLSEVTQDLTLSWETVGTMRPSLLTTYRTATCRVPTTPCRWVTSDPAPDTAASAVARASTWAIRTSGTVVGFLQCSASVTPMRSTSAGAVVHGAKVRMVGLSLRKDN